MTDETKLNLTAFHDTSFFQLRGQRCGRHRRRVTEWQRKERLMFTHICSRLTIVGLSHKTCHFLQKQCMIHWIELYKYSFRLFSVHGATEFVILWKVFNRVNAESANALLFSSLLFLQSNDFSIICPILTVCTLEGSAPARTVGSAVCNIYIFQSFT